MTNPFVFYVLGSSICLMLFLVVYRLLISNLTYFSWMRMYLLISVILSLILPLVTLNIQWKSSIHTADLFNYAGLFTGQHSVGPADQTLRNDLSNNFSGLLQKNIPIFLIAGYITGLLFKTLNFARNLSRIRNLVNQNPKKREGRFWLVELNDEVPPFSFFNHIFIANSYKELSTYELHRIIDHEKVHAQQFHSLDILFFEFISVIFWFNPLFIYLKKSIREIHEYIVDEKIAETGKGKKDYAELLLKLTSEVKGFNLSAGFSGSQIMRRITMISRQRSLPRHKFMFIALIPITLIMMLSFSYIKNTDPVTPRKKQIVNEFQNQLKIGKITWKGNKVYDIETLNHVLKLKEGSIYNKSLLGDRLNGTSGAQDAVSNLYQDNGYLFNRITFVEKENNGIVDLTITIDEGKQAKFRDIIVKIDGVVTNDPVYETGIHKGDLFSKAKIIIAIRMLSATGKVDPEKINPKPMPIITNDEFDYIDLLFELTAISNKM